MIPYKTFAVVGGDLRQVRIANRLAQEGNTVYALLMEENELLMEGLACSQPFAQVLPLCDVVIFPLPLSTDEQTVNTPFSTQKATISDCFSAIRPDAAVFAGRVGATAGQLAQQNHLQLTDYLKREELAVKNAIITAEGAVAIAMEELPVSMFGLQCLLVGHGRIAKALMRILNGLNVQLTVAARKYGDLAMIEEEGGKAVHISQLPTAVADAQLIINTVPAQLFTRSVLEGVPKDTLLLDLASRPGGIDLQAAKELGCKTIWALSLPGKTAPISAGDIILQTIYNCLSEQEVQ
ncbi:MAG: dipicolinate synthase subunit DpsA [Anaerotruncus sp.]|nr:dipicolinate synthase subunit DpsA [Anaerotruncus sp.]